MTSQLANRFIKRPLGILEDVFLKVNKPYFPIDFIILDMVQEDSYYYTRKTIQYDTKGYHWCHKSPNCFEGARKIHKILHVFKTLKQPEEGRKHAC